jgi:hypothetical protein
MHRDDRGGGVIIPLIRGTESRGCLPLAPLPPCERCFGLVLPPPPPSMCLLIEGMFRLPPDCILGQIGVPQFTATAPKTLCKAMSMMKR